MSLREDIQALDAKVQRLEDAADTLIALFRAALAEIRDNASNAAQVQAIANRVEAQIAEVEAADDPEA